jgi:hypothetical protein
LFSAASRLPKRRSMLSRSSVRATSMARVAPMLEANDTSTVPHNRPKIAPPASVMIAAPGSDRAVTAT